MVSGFIVHVFAYGERAIHEGPSFFTTGGIFFTFVGIAEGLYGFDPQNIEASVPALLDGLKTAFIASVVGVFIALSIKLRYALLGIPQSKISKTVTGGTIDDLITQMASVQHALVGEEESTLLSQLKLLRQDTNDRLEGLRKSQAEFMARMAQDNSKALIEALQEVIRDFNTKISEQFGDNFKELNEAVGRLLKWQEAYRDQLTQIIEQQARITDNINTASDRYSRLIADAETFARVSGQLQSILTGLETQRRQLETSLKSLAELVLAASEGLPKIEGKIVQLTEQMTFGVKHHQSEVTTALRSGSEIVRQALDDTKKLLLATTQANNQEVNSHMKHLAERTNEQITKLDAALEQELTRSISSLGKQLTALSNRFVEDYRPLTEALRDLVRARGAVN